MVKIVLYRACGNWYWYLLDINMEFNNLLPPAGCKRKLRDALASARKDAQDRGLSVSFSYIEKDADDRR